MELMLDFKQRFGPWALIAGASEGIGLCYSQLLAKQGINLIMISRRESTLEQSAKLITDNYDVQVKTIALDLVSDTLEDDIEKIATAYEIGLLIYNAGAMHGADLFHDQALSTIMKLVDLNCRGPLAFCHILGKPMRERGRGGIILMSSLAAFGGGSYVAAYSATKSFDLVLGQSLWHEMKPFGVDVLSLVAGASDTPAMAASGVQFEGYAKPMDAMDVAQEGLERLGSGPMWVAGAQNRENAAEFKRQPLEYAIESISQGAMTLYNKPYPSPTND